MWICVERIIVLRDKYSSDVKTVLQCHEESSVVAKQTLLYFMYLIKL